MSGLGDLELGECLLGDGQGGTTIRNLGFEAGAFGFASSWEQGSAAELATVATFGLWAVEDFEHAWSNMHYAFDLEDTTVAPFSVDVYITPRSYEDFERGWDNFPFFTVSFSAVACVFTGPLDAEDFEEGWDNDPYLTEFTDPDLTAVVFSSAETFESFEEGWENDAYLEEFGGGDTTAMAISGELAASVEDFESVKDPQVYTGDAGADTILTTAHGLAADYRVVFDLPVAGAVPTPVAPLIPYYVQAVPDADSFAIALLPGAGSPADITTTGSGLLRWSAPYEFWTTRMATL